MATVIIILILILIVIYTIISYKKKLSSGCCGGESDVSFVKPKDTDITHYPYTKKVYIEGMTCSHCKRKIENCFHNEDGFLMEISLNNNVGILRMKDDVNDEKIIYKIESLGYKVKSIEKI
jgi:copper chaperone CopZ